MLRRNGGVFAIALSVFIVAATRLYQDGLSFALGRRRGIDVVGSSTGVWEAVAELRRLLPDVALVDCIGIDAGAGIRRIRAEAPGVKIVALGVPPMEDQIVGLAEAGADGFVTRDGSLDDLVAALESAVRDEALCSPKLVATLIQRIAVLASNRDQLPSVSRVTPREREVVGLIAEGLSNKEIAARLTIEVATVKNHIHNILEKLQVHRRDEAVARMRNVL